MQAPTDAGTGTGSLRFASACISSSKSSRPGATITGNRPAGVAWISIRTSSGRRSRSAAGSSGTGTELRMAAS